MHSSSASTADRSAVGSTCRRRSGRLIVPRRCAEDPHKSWKLTDEDWRNREKRPAYEAAVEDVLECTDHAKGRWHVVAGDDKRYARVAVVERVSRMVEADLSDRGYELADVPDAMERQRPATGVARCRG